VLGAEFRVTVSPVLASPVLRRLLPAFAVSAVGDGMSAVGVAWLAIRIAPPADRGLAVAAYTLPGAAGRRRRLLRHPGRGSGHGQGPPEDARARECRPGRPGSRVRGDRPQQAAGRASRPDGGLLLPVRAGRGGAAAVRDWTAGWRRRAARLFWTVFGVGATVGSIIAGLARRLPVWPVLVAAVIGWSAALTPLGLLRLTVPAMACFAVGGLLYAPYPACQPPCSSGKAPRNCSRRSLRPAAR
jgi:hypothetical protein